MCDRRKCRRLCLTRLAEISGSSFHRQGAAYLKERLGKLRRILETSDSVAGLKVEKLGGVVGGAGE